MKRVNHSILPKQHPRKKSIVRSVHNSFYERGNRATEVLPQTDTYRFLPYAGKEYGFAYASAWDIDQISKSSSDESSGDR